MDQQALDEFIERARSLRRKEELDRITAGLLDGFESAGVRCLVLKGPALARLLYRDDEVRSYGDIDLLVGPKDVTGARDVLSASGFNRADEVFGIDDVAGIQYSEIWARRGKDSPLWIDLHRSISGCEASDEIVWSALSATRKPIDLGGREAWVPGIPALALHLALHAAQHGPSDGKAMADLARGLERWGREIWRAAARLAAELEALGSFAAGLRLQPAGAELAGELELPRADELEWKIRNRESRPRGTFHLNAMAEAQGFRQRLNVLRRSLIPPHDWMIRQFRWAERSRAHLLMAYVVHVLRAPAWALQARRFLRRAKSASSLGAPD